MAVNKTTKVDPPDEDKSSPPSLAFALDYTPLSLNHLVREGIRLYSLEACGHASFQLNLAQNLNKVVGAPVQLRRLFAQLIDGLVESAGERKPIVELSTQNVCVAPIAAREDDDYNGLRQGAYAILRVELYAVSNLGEDNSGLQESQADDLAVTCAEWADGGSIGSRMAFNEPFRLPFNQNRNPNSLLWSQIQEIVELHRGWIINEYPTNSLVALSIALPTIHLLQ